MRNDIQFIVQPVPWALAYDLYMRHNGAWANGDIGFTQISDGEVPPATLCLTAAQAQEFVDQLWKAGIRPTEGTGSAGSLAATERHLEDMRALVFNHLFTGEKP